MKKLLIALFIAGGLLLGGYVSALDLMSLGLTGVANGDSTEPVTSNNGRYVVFQSNASNLVSGDTNGQTDVFLLDR